MADARQFSVLYNLVSKICQDQSVAGQSNAKDGINTVIKEITREFKLPEIFKGQDNSVFVTPLIGVGPQLLTLATDIVRLEDVWYIENNSENYILDEIDSNDDWLEMTDLNTSGDPVIYRDWQPSSANIRQIQIWPSPNTSWINQSGGKLYYSYWAQLAQLVNDTDIPNLPYELDTILVNGGVVETARMQGDTVLISLYEGKYENDKGEIRAWLIKQHEKDVQMRPDDPVGVFGKDRGVRGYKIDG